MVSKERPNIWGEIGENDEKRKRENRTGGQEKNDTQERERKGYQKERENEKEREGEDGQLS